MRHPFVLLFVLSMHALLLVAALRPDLLPHWKLALREAALVEPPDPPPPQPASPAPQDTPPAKSGTKGAAATAPETSPMDPAAWLERQQRARTQYRERHFGPQIAQTLEAPDGGLDALADLARQGDARALEAWSQRADDCQSADHPPAGVLARTSAETSPATAPSPRRAFADAIVQARRDADAQLALTCAKANTDRGVLEAAWRDLADSRSVAAQLAAAELQFDQDGDLPRLIARLREVVAATADPGARRALAMHLTESAAGAEREEGLLMLRRMAAQDEEAFGYLAQCLAIGCGALAPRPDEAGDLLERSAELGFAWALERVIDEAVRHDRAVEALGWSRYREWLNAHGCFAAPADLGLRFLLSDTQLEETQGALLAPALSLDADRLAQAHVQRGGNAARRRANCD
jgi:hypothetical protein